MRHLSAAFGSRRSGWNALLRRAAWCAVSGVALASGACNTMSRPTMTGESLTSSEQVALAGTKGTASIARADLRGQSPPTAMRRPAQAGPISPSMAVDCPVCPMDCPPGVGRFDDERFDDEYLCDGGDRDQPVHYEAGEMVGLDTEDTVAEYDDEEGRRRIRPTNKRCIYAPRFSAIVSVSAALVDVGSERAIESFVSEQGSGLKTRDVTFVHEQRDASQRMETRLRGSTLRTDASVAVFDRPEILQAHLQTIAPHVNFTFLRTGRMIQSESALLAQRVQSAVTWTRDQNPVIAATYDVAGEVKSRFAPEELAGAENRAGGKGRLRIVKLADKDTAAVDDVITFTIRYDNVGDRPVTHVVIVDNLTPRLDYVEGSATSDRQGQMIPAENGEGSLILRWELDEPLAPHKGGVVTFQARVR